MRQLSLLVLVLALMSECSKYSVFELSSDLTESYLAQNLTLKVVTFNIQDTYVVGKHRPERMQAIAATLCELDPDIVGFQESFIYEDRKVLMDRLIKGSRLKYHQYYPSPVAGSGLLISSAYQIVDKSFHRFEASNPFYKVWEADWWGGKGVALAKIKLPEDAGILNLYNTHTQADYEKADYEVVRSNQLSNLAKYVRETKGNQSPSILIGDMNCLSGDVEFQSLVSEADLMHMMSIDSGLDHIFALRDSLNAFDVLKTTKIQAEIVVKEAVTALSDHLGYMTTLSITPRNKDNQKEQKYAKLILD